MLGIKLEGNDVGTSNVAQLILNVQPILFLSATLILTSI